MAEKKILKPAKAPEVTPLKSEKPPKPATGSYPPPEPDGSAEYARYVREVS